MNSLPVFFSFIENNDLEGARNVAPWGEFSGPRSMTNVVGLALIAALAEPNPHRWCKSLLQFIAVHADQLHPDTKGTLVLKIMAVVLHALAHPKTAAEVWALTNQDPFLFRHTAQALLATDEVFRFTSSLLADCPEVPGTPFRYLRLIKSYREEILLRDRRVTEIFAYCFLLNSRIFPLIREIRVVLLKNISRTCFTDLQQQGVALLHVRAEKGLWRQGAEAELGRTILWRELRAVWKKDAYAAIRLDRWEDWAQLPFLMQYAGNNPRKKLAVLSVIMNELLGYQHGDKALEVGALYYKEALLTILDQHFSYFSKKGHLEGTIKFILDQLDDRDLLHPADISRLTAIFAKQKITPVVRDFYYSLVYPYLIRFHHPEQGFNQAAILLKRPMCDIIHCRDFEKICLVRDASTAIHTEWSYHARLLWHHLQFSDIHVENFDLQERMAQFGEEVPEINCSLYVSLLYHAALPEYCPSFLPHCPEFIRLTHEYALHEAGEGYGRTHTEFTEQVARASGIAESLFRFLASIFDNHIPLEYTDGQVQVLRFRLFQFVETIFPKLNTRREKFFEELLNLFEKAPWLVFSVTLVSLFDFLPQHTNEEIERFYAALKPLGAKNIFQLKEKL